MAFAAGGAAQEPFERGGRQAGERTRLAVSWYSRQNSAWSPGDGHTAVADSGAIVYMSASRHRRRRRVHRKIPRGTLLKVGDVIMVEIQKVEPERGRISVGEMGVYPGGRGCI